MSDAFKSAVANLPEAGKIENGKYILPKEWDNKEDNAYNELLSEIPNAVTLAALKEIEEGHLKRFYSIDELFEDLNSDDC